MWHAVISKVEERSVTISGRKAADGNAELQVESAGWYVHLGTLSIYVGEEEPGFKKGQRVKLTLEKE